MHIQRYSNFMNIMNVIATYDQVYSHRLRDTNIIVKALLNVFFQIILNVICLL